MTSRINLEELASPSGDPASAPMDSIIGSNWDSAAQYRAGQSTVPIFTRAEILEQMLNVWDYERRRMGQELHDSAGQLLVALQLSVAHLQDVHDATSLADLLDEIRDTVRQIDREIRSVSFLNCPTELGAHGLGLALQALAHGFARRTGIQVDCQSNDEGAVGEGPASVALLRIAQEALVNIHRHAQASAVRLALKRRRDVLELTISDNGIGIPSDDELEKRHGLGLQGMRHRAEQLAGGFDIKRLKHGTRISARVPFAN
jgi:signal transduction histidine kinase